jgi:hypothetical protein
VEGQAPFRSLQEAYSRWKGVNSWDLDAMEMMEDFHAKYDSQRNHLSLQESITTASWGTIFADALYKRMMRVYQAYPYNAWTALVSDIDTVSNFMTQKWSRIGGYGDLAQVGQGKPYPDMTSPDSEQITYNVAKYGGVDDITWEATLQDDMNQIRNIPQGMAFSAIRTLYKFVTGLATTTNPTMPYDSVAMYHATHNNLGSAALTLRGLDGTDVAMAQQVAYGRTDVIGDINVPKILIVPRALSARAKRIIRPSAAYEIVATDGTVVGDLGDTGTSIDPQAFADRDMQVFVNDLLTDTNDWYAVADPRLVSTMVIGFLNGRRDPDIFVQDSQTVGSVFNADKITYKIRFIFGGAILDHRSFYKNSL